MSYDQLLTRCFFFHQLLIGNFGLSYEQSKSQFALWAILAAVSYVPFFSNCPLIFDVIMVNILRVVWRHMRLLVIHFIISCNFFLSL